MKRLSSLLNMLKRIMGMAWRSGQLILGVGARIDESTGEEK